MLHAAPSAAARSRLLAHRLPFAVHAIASFSSADDPHQTLPYDPIAAAHPQNVPVYEPSASWFEDPPRLEMQQIRLDPIPLLDTPTIPTYEDGVLPPELLLDVWRQLLPGADAQLPGDMASIPGDGESSNPLPPWQPVVPLEISEPGSLEDVTDEELRQILPHNHALDSGDLVIDMEAAEKSPFGDQAVETWDPVPPRVVEQMLMGLGAEASPLEQIARAEGVTAAPPDTIRRWP